MDAYQTNIQDRIGVTSQINIANDTILNENVLGLDLNTFEFFTNLINTETRGIDAILAAQFNTHLYEIGYSSFSYFQTKLESGVISIDRLEDLNIE